MHRPGEAGSRHRDVTAFADRAARYDEGWLGRLHGEIVGRAADLALDRHPRPRVILDVGCGTGTLLGLVGARRPDADLLLGIDPAPAMIDVAARSLPADDRLHLTVGAAERLPYRDGAVDLLVTTTSFDHWSDQRLGLSECARVLEPGGTLVLVDLLSALLAPTLLAGRRDRARTRHRATALLEGAGLSGITWEPAFAGVLRAVTAVR